jgi:hypothetical protein
VLPDEWRRMFSTTITEETIGLPMVVTRSVAELACQSGEMLISFVACMHQSVCGHAIHLPKVEKNCPEILATTTNVSLSLEVLTAYLQQDTYAL